MVKFSVIVPCYNESKNIPLIISAFKKAVGTRDDIEILLVDNGSNDDSKEVFLQQITNEKIFKLVNVKKNQGYGFGILSGLEVALGDVLAWTHADMQTDPADVICGFEFYQKENNQKVFIKGKRRNRKIFEYVMTLGMQTIASLVLKVFLDDINAQPKIFSRSFYESFIKNKAPHDFSFDLFMLYQAKKNNFLVKEIDVSFKKRIHGEAKGGGASLWVRIKIIKRTLAYIFKLRNLINS